MTCRCHKTVERSLLGYLRALLAYREKSTYFYRTKYRVVLQKPSRGEKAQQKTVELINSLPCLAPNPGVAELSRILGRFFNS